MMQMVLPPYPSLSGHLCDDESFLMFDNFPGEYSAVNGPPPKAPIIGSGVWAVTGASAANAFSGGGILALNVDSGNAYAQIALGEIPGEIGCTFQYVGPLPDDDVNPTPTLACYQAFDTFSQNNFHFVAGRHIFDWTYWKGGAPNLQPAWKIPNLYALAPNAFYTYRVLIDPPYAFGFLFDSAGTQIGNITINEPNMASVVGQYMFVQLFSTKLNYRSVWARRKSGNSLAQACMVRGVALHVGAGTPSGVLSARYDGSFGAPAPKIAAFKGDAELGISAELSGAARLVLSTALPPIAITGASIAKAGAGYKKNDLLDVTGGTLHLGGPKAQLRVDNVGPGGAIMAISVVRPGLYDDPPGNPAKVDQRDAEFSLVGTGTSTFSSRIEQRVLSLVFLDVNNNVWLTKPVFDGNLGSDFPYVPSGIRVGGATGPCWLSGQGSPEGQVAAPIGSLFSRADGGPGPKLYVKETGTGNTGWTAK